MENPLNYPCSDMLEFQEMLKKMRQIDDKIVYELNESVPTVSFSKQLNATEKCESLYKQLRKSYSDRDKAIQHCIKISNSKVENLKHLQDAKPDDSKITTQLRREQLQLRMFKSELGVEEIIKDRSLKAFSEKCRTAYKPPDVLI